MRNSHIVTTQKYTFTTPSGSSVMDSGYHSDRCSSSTIVHGDFVTPNSWSYDIDDHYTWKAKTIVTATNGQWQQTFDGYTNNNCMLYPRAGQILADCREDALNQLVSSARGDLDLVTSTSESASEGRDWWDRRSRQPPTLTTRAPRLYPALAAWADFMERAVGRGIRGRTRLAADIWLSMKYRWLPLLSDIYGAADEAIRGGGNRRVIRARRMRPIAEVIRQHEALFGALVPAYYAFNGKVGVEFKFVITDPEFDLARWGTCNPALVAWNLVPTSFVADWFFNVGDYLRAAETALLFSNRVDYGYESNLVAYDVLGTATGTYTPWNGVYATEGSAQRRIIQFNRIGLTVFPSPRLPTWNPHLGWQRVISAGALTSGFFR